ncbi:hypothetical protein F4825DRAFT_25119 [Nemania diffusa]|nr:hypothetical protein F4825DRAFT_25119 [Nemania diffusa]
MSDNEVASGGSSPKLVSDSISENDLTQTMMLGQSFLEEGDLKSAARAFLRCQRILRSSESHQNMRYDMVIQTVLARIKLHRGMYKEAQEALNSILRGMDRNVNSRKGNTVERWIAVSLLHQGQYEEAAKRFRSLLGTIDTNCLDHITTEITIRRNLALAFTYQGIYGEAFSQIKGSATHR